MPSDVFNPYLPEDEQDMEMKPVILGPPGYGSPDPETQNATMVPIEEHALELNPEFGSEVKEAEGSAIIEEESDENGEAAEGEEAADSEDSEMPAKTATRAEWDDYARSKGVDPDLFGSKDELIAELS